MSFVAAIDSSEDVQDIEKFNKGCSEGTSSVAFEVLIINCQIYFIHFFVFNCLTLNIKLLIFKLFDVKFLFSENHAFRKQKRTAVKELWMRVLSFGF